MASVSPDTSGELAVNPKRSGHFPGTPQSRLKTAQPGGQMGWPLPHIASIAKNEPLESPE